eukprot:9408856-Lingulodinium_polyedra.AAC.1
MRGRLCRQGILQPHLRRPGHPEMAIIDQGHGYHDGRPMVLPCVAREVFPDQCFVGVRLDDQHIH